MASPDATRDIPNLNENAAREIGGALIAGAVIGAVLLLWEESLERRRDGHDDSQAASRAKRDEWTALMIQISSIGQNLMEIDLRGKHLHGLLLPIQANLVHARLGNTNLRGAYLRTAQLGEASLNGSDLTGANLSRVKGSKVDFDDASLRNVELAGAELHDCTFRNADFRGAILLGAQLIRPDLRGANMGNLTHS